MVEQGGALDPELRAQVLGLIERDYMFGFKYVMDGTRILIGFSSTDHIEIAQGLPDEELAALLEGQTRLSERPQLPGVSAGRLIIETSGNPDYRYGLLVTSGSSTLRIDNDPHQTSIDAAIRIGPAIAGGDYAVGDIRDEIVGKSVMLCFNAPIR